MVIHTENHHFVLHKALHDKMSKLYIFQAIFTFVKGLIGIFIPVYLYSIGYSLIQVIFYGILTSIVFLLIIPVTVKIIRNLGFKYTILFALSIYFLHIFSINYVEENILFFHLAWLTIGIHQGIFWPTYHSEIAVNSNKNSMGSNIGTLQIFTTLFGTLAPFVGGFILTKFGYYSLFIFSIIVLLVGILPLIFAKDIKVKSFNFEYKDYIRLIKNKKFQNSKIAFKCQGVDHALAITIWPLILFTLLDKNFTTFGTLITIVSLIAVSVLIYLKKHIDKHNKNKVLNIMSKFLSLNWFMRFVVIFIGSFFLYFVESFNKIVGSAFFLPYMAIFYNNAKKGVYLEYIILREFYVHSVRILVLLLTVLLLWTFGESIYILSIMIFFGMFFALGLTYLKEE